MKTKLNAAARKAEKDALREYKNWENDWIESDSVYLAIYDAVFCAWLEATGRRVGETDAELEANDQAFMDDPVADAVMAPYTEKYNAR